MKVRKRNLDNEITEKYFSDIARTKRSNDASNADKFSDIRGLLLSPDSGRLLLECGAGGGFYTRRLLQEGYQVTAVDLSDDALRVNREQAAELGLSEALTTITANFVEYSSKPLEQYDQVVFLKVLHHFDSIENISLALEGAISCCREGGRVVLFEPNGKNPLWRLFLSIIRDPVTGKSKWFYEKNMRFTKMHTLLGVVEKIAGRCDKDILVETRYHYVIPVSLIQRIRWGRGLLYRINHLLERSPLRFLFCFNISIVINVGDNG